MGPMLSAREPPAVSHQACDGEPTRLRLIPQHVVETVAGVCCSLGCLSSPTGAQSTFVAPTTPQPDRGLPSTAAARRVRAAGPVDGREAWGSGKAAAVLLAAAAASGRSRTGRRASRRTPAQRRQRGSVAMSAIGDQRRVVVTGMGVVSPLGCSLDVVAESLEQAKSGVVVADDHIEFGLTSHVIGRPPLSDKHVKELVPRKALRFIGPNAQFQFIALQSAIEHAGFETKDYEENPRCANITGQGGTSYGEIREADEAMQKHGPWADNKWGRKMGPYRVTRTMGSASSAVLSSWFKIQGPSYSVSSACSTGAHVIGHGMEQIQLDRVDIAFVGAGEETGWEFSSMFDAMGSLSAKYNSDPAKASRPLDKNSDGFVIAGGAGMLVLEELEHAKARGAKIYAELVGYGACADGFDVVKISGDGCERSMRIAMEMADSLGGEKPIDYINLACTGITQSDITELNAIKRVFKDKGYQPYVSSTKSLSGNALAAAGVHEAIYSLLMMDKGFLARSTNVDDPIDESKDMKLPLEGYTGPLKRVMTNSAGFGGTNACLIFDKWTGD